MYTVHNAFPGITYPRAPGHEVVGTIDALGRRGDCITCRKLQVPGMAYDGGYSEYIVVPIVALARIPDGLSDAEAAPLMCAGVTVFNSLRNSLARPGDLVASPSPGVEPALQKLGAPMIAGRHSIKEWPSGTCADSDRTRYRSL